MADDWLDKIIAERGADCPACNLCWRMLNGRELETCPHCGDDAYDVFEIERTDIP